MSPDMRRSQCRSSGGRRIQALRIFLLLLLFAQLVFSVVDKSPTIDEPNHLTRGYAYLKTGDLRMSRDEGHPPLFNLICALPLLLIRGFSGQEGLELPVHLYSWQSGFRNAFAVEWLFGEDVPLAQVVFLGRLPVMLATMCLAALVVRWAGDLYGPWSSILALALCAFDPNLIAHGQLATTDMGSTLFILATCYLFSRFLRAPAWSWLVATGVSLGLAQGTKFSALVLLPLLGLLGLMEALHAQSSLCLPARIAGARIPRRLLPLAVLAGVMVLLLALAGLTVWAIYGFQVGRPEGWAIDVPAPVYVEGLQKTLAHAADFGHPTFLMGQRSTHGWWYYFPIAFALKTPLPALIVLIGALVSLAWHRLRRAEVPLLLVPAIYIGVGMGSVLNIGYRHLLPTLPFLWVYTGRLAPILGARAGVRERWAKGLVVVGLVMWLVFSTLSVAPHYLAYFNALAGGPDGGWRYLVDSNLDWGQDLPGLKAYLDEHSPEPVHLSWFGCTYPHLYGLDLEYRLLPSHFSYPYPGDAARSPYNPLYPAPGLYAIGVTNLNGVGLAAGDVFERFRPKEPLARIGHSIHIYRVETYPVEPNPTCISGLRFKDLSAETEALSLGRGPGAVKWFDQERSFILPAAGEPAYVLTGSALGFATAWQEVFLARAQVAHVQAEGEPAPSGRSLPIAVVYRLDRASADDLRQAILADLGSTSDVQAAPISWSPSAAFGPGDHVEAEMHPLSSPISFEHGLELLGYVLLTGDTLRPGEALELLTLWRPVAEMPPAAYDLRIFVHLLDDQSKVWGGEDRLDLHPPTWEAGDLLIQHHRVPLAADADTGTYQLEIGLYTAITIERLAVYVAGSPVADRLLLQPIQVR